MKVALSRSLWACVACLSFWPVLLFAGTPDPAANLSACKKGWPACERSRLTLSEMTEVALAKHARKQEAAAVDLAVHRSNMANCKDGRDTCDYSLLTRSEAYTLAAAERRRNYTACLSRHGYCDRSRLTPSEAAAIPPPFRLTPQ